MYWTRRRFFKHSLSAAALIAGAPWLSSVQATWPKSAFRAKSVAVALQALVDGAKARPGRISIQAPGLAEDGAVVPIEISSDLQGVTVINILVAKNPRPLVARLDLSPGVEPFVATHIKMAETSDIIALLEVGDDLYRASRSVRVIHGGCS